MKLSDFGGAADTSGDAPQTKKTLSDYGGASESSPQEKSESHGFIAGLEGAVTRGLAPIATGAALGAGAGAVLGGGVGAIPGAATGAGLAIATELATSLYNPLAEKFGWPKSATPQEMTDRVLDLAGVVRPNTPLERTVEAAAGGLAGGLGGARAAGRIAENALSPTVKSVAETAAAKPGLQAVSGATGGASAQTAKEAEAPWWLQYVAGMAGGGIPYLKEALPLAARAPSTPQAREAVKAGFVYPPHELTPLGEKASLVSRTGESEAGKIKLQQEASVRNQTNTQNLAAEAIGLPPGTFLGERAFEQAKAPAIAVYREVENAVPEVTLAKDSQYQREVSNLGERKSLVETFFPELKDNPEIRDLRAMMARNASVPTAVATKTVADLRFNAGINLKAMGNAQKHALGLAQREAADALEGAIERSVKNAPRYYADKIKDVSRELATAHQAENSATNALSRSMPGSPLIGSLQQELSAAQERVAVLTEQRNGLVKGFKESSLANADNQTLYDRFKDARKLFAKIYNVEDATNRTTGEVSAAGLARVYNKGAPFTDQLKTIADAWNVSPKSMQMPSKFGGSEDWSALDFFGTMAALAHGNVGVAGAIASRPLVRRKLLSPRYQGAAIGQAGDSAFPTPLITNPGFQAVVPAGSDASKATLGVQ